MSKGTDKRKYKRIGKPFMVRFRIRPNKTQEVVSTDWDMVKTEDLGAGGMFFNYSKKLKVGSTVDMKFGVSEFAPDINCAGVIIRINKQQRYSVFDIAVAFTEIKEKDKELINKKTEEF